MTQTQIETERLIAKTLTTDELKEFAISPGNIAVKMNISIPPGEPDAALSDAIVNFLLPGTDGSGPDYLFYTLWLIIEKQTREMTGSFCFHGKPENRTVEVGYGINPLFRNRGYITEMLTGIIGWVQQRGDIDFLTAETETENIPSKKALEKAGFTLTEIKENGLIYSIRLTNL